MKRKTKTIMSVLSAFFVLAGILSFAFLSVKAEGNVTEIFPDVKEGAWYVKFVQYVYDNGIMAGNKDGTFGPDKPLLREQFSQVLYSIAGKPGVAANAANPFTDVKNNPGYPRDAILWAYENGIASGNADRTFGVGSRIQRQAVASMLYKYASANGYDLSSNDNALSGFSDSSKVETWAVTSMKWAVSQGIVAGKSGRLDPAGTATRAECAAMIMQLLKKNENVHRHVYDLKIAEEKYLKSAASCTKPAEYYFSCECGEYTKNKSFESGKALGHIWDNGTVTKEATEDEEGVKTYQCTRTGCNETKTEAIPKLPHTHSYTLKVTDSKYLKSAASCTKPAEYYFSCKCGDYTKDSSFTSGNALGHKWDNGTVTKEATEDEEGVKTYHCTRTGCNETKTEEIPKLPHTHSYTLQVAESKYLKSAATCTKPAVYYYSCKCGEFTKSKTFESGEALGHIWDNGTVTKEATEDEEGVKTYHCTRTGCNETKTETIPKLSHTHSYTLKVTDSKYLKSAANCTKPAEYYYSCKCGEFTNTKTFESGEALGHIWDNGTVTKEATEEEAGVKTYHCTRTGCNETKTEEIPKLPHTHSYTLQVAESKYLKSAATCTKPAVYYYSCKCGEFTKSKTFENGEALGHIWDNGTVTKEATEEEEGVLTYHCTRTGCSATKTEAIPKVVVTPLMDWHSILDFPEPVPDEENPEGRMSHNIYSNPSLADTSGKYSGFLIDFCSDHAPGGTIWSLCDFKMDLSELKKQYNVTDEGGAAAGFQNWYGKDVYMDFYDIHYTNDNNQDVSILATQVYPEHGYVDYPWTAGKWYRMYLCSYDDSTTGHTFVEQWVQNIEAGNWTKISCYDTGLTHSCITGTLSQCMYNGDEDYCSEIRSFAYRNIYERENDGGQWKTTKQSELVVDSWWDDKKGNYAYTADENTLYGITCGYGPDAATLNEDISGTFKIEPTVGPTYVRITDGVVTTITEEIPVETITPIMDWHSILDFPEPVPQEENPEERMAHNIYSDPVLDGTSGRYSGFLIDFCSDHAAASTYWALCNWNMDITDFKSKYTVLGSENSAGAYAGLQSRVDGKKAIMSFWEIKYLDENNNEQSLRAKRVYPEGGETNQFGGEGEGSNYITDYYWKTGKWYRMYICCYDDASTGHTFVEQWVMDIEKGVWTKISCFDTGLCHSYFKGAMSQFMENYSWKYSNEVRTFAYRNMYVREYDTGEWKALNESTLSIDTGYGNKKGNFAFTADGNTFYGITCGYGPDAAAPNEDIRRKYAISSTSGPVTP